MIDEDEEKSIQEGENLEPKDSIPVPFIPPMLGRLTSTKERRSKHHGINDESNKSGALNDTKGEECIWKSTRELREKSNNKICPVNDEIVY